MAWRLRAFRGFVGDEDEDSVACEPRVAGLPSVSRKSSLRDEVVGPGAFAQAKLRDAFDDGGSPTACSSGCPLYTEAW